MSTMPKWSWANGEKDRSLDQTRRFRWAYVFKSKHLAKDRFDQPVFLFENDFALRWFADKYPDVELEEKM